MPLVLPLLALAPLATEVTIVVGPESEAKPISPFIYGTNFPEWDGATREATFTRAGGNRWTAYNWETNASNAGNDYRHQNDAFLGGGDTPGEAMLPAVRAALSRGKAFLATIPMAGYVSADKNADGDVNATPGYLDKRFLRSYANSPQGTDLRTPPNLTDRAVYQDQFVALLTAARPDTSARLWFSLDNEPDLWASTHARIQTQPLTYAALLAKTTEYARMIKRVSPKSLVFGPASYGWQGYRSLQNAPDANGRDFLSYYLREMAAAERSSGRRLLDVLDLHYYPEAQGGGKRVTESLDDPAIEDARVQAPRSLYDPTYVEDSWITRASTNGRPIYLLPTVRKTIADAYPGTRLAFTEYDFGGRGISGGVAQADVFGAFGREGVFAASLWSSPKERPFAYASLGMYRNYDGKGSDFGPMSVGATSSDLARVSAWAGWDPKAKRRTLVLINRSRASASVLGRMTGAGSGTARLWRLTGAVAERKAAGTTAVVGGRFALDLPAMSVTTFELR